jgi:hypothetical protein
MSLYEQKTVDLDVPTPDVLEQQVNPLLDLLDDAIAGGHPLDETALTDIREQLVFNALVASQLDGAIRAARSAGVDCSHFILHDDTRRPS